MDNQPKTDKTGSVQRRFRNDPPGWVGPKIREARQRRGLSQADLARSSGLSVSFIRLLETGKSDVSMSRFLKLSAALGIPIADLIHEGETSTISLAHPSDRVELPSREKGVHLFLLFPRGESTIEPALCELEPGVSMRKSLFHRGRDFVFVLKGRVKLEVGGSEIELRAGDAADFRSSIPHRFSNCSQTAPASFLITDAG